jgi:hypothetical protein
VTGPNTFPSKPIPTKTCPHAPLWAHVCSSVPGLSTDRFFKFKEEKEMNVKRSVVVVAACLCVAALSLVTYRAGASSVNWKVNSQWKADGGAPTPPWPPKMQLVADGGAPTPPWPKLPSKLTLVADGGAPTPPWPPNTQLVADGGAPTPPWPKPPAANQSA